MSPIIITTDDGATFSVPRPIRQDLAMPLPVVALPAVTLDD